ncbi:MAG: helix-turn-helix domain-containing protein [Hydrogenibacillus sp.]|nr:helix-turn-helix domain-containing protein [Hydrogenibacillus sp.]
MRTVHTSLIEALRPWFARRRTMHAAVLRLRQPLSPEDRRALGTVAEAYGLNGVWRFFRSPTPPSDGRVVRETLSDPADDRALFCFTAPFLKHADDIDDAASGLVDAWLQEAHLTVALTYDGPFDAVEVFAAVLPWMIRAAEHVPFGAAEPWPRRLGALVVDLLADDARRPLAEAVRARYGARWPEGTWPTVRALWAERLNVSRAARSLEVHRNTLLYRLGRLKEATGLDPRRFDDALALYILARLAPDVDERP